MIATLTFMWLPQHHQRMKMVKPVDMFPWAVHVETCVLLYRKDYKVGEKGKKVTVEVGMNK